MGHMQRIEAPALVYYISCRGRDHRRLFLDDKDRLQFIDLLRSQKIKSNLIFYAYVLLDTQYAFLLQTTQSNLTQAMHLINSNHANALNRRHRLRGKLYKGRYKSFVLPTGYHQVEASCYLHTLPATSSIPFTLPIHNPSSSSSSDSDNPSASSSPTPQSSTTPPRISAPTLSLDRLLSFRWSSLPGYIDLTRQEDWIDYDTILDKFNGNTPDACLNYRDRIAQRLAAKNPSPFASIRKTTILGTDEFWQKIYEKARSAKARSPADEKALAQKIIKASHKAMVDAPVLARNAAIYFIKKYTALDNRAISTLFEELKAGSISQMSRRFRLALEDRSAIHSPAAKLENKTLCSAADELEDVVRRIVEE